MRPALLGLALILTLAGCAGGNPHLRADLRSADRTCNETKWPNRTDQVNCYLQHERPVWAQDEPAMLDLYDTYARERAELARQVDQGIVPKDEFDHKLSQLDDEFRARIAARRDEAKPTS